MIIGYRCNESSGTSVADSSGNGNTGTITGGVTFVAGHYGNACSFNGSTGFIDSTTMTGWSTGTDQISVCAWVNPSSNTLDQYVADGYDAGGGNRDTLLLGFQDGFYNFYDAGYPTGTASDTQMTATTGAFHHVCYTWTGAAGGTIKGYLDGTLTINKTAAHSLRTHTHYILGKSSGGSNFSSAIVDNFRVYNVTLDAAGVTQDMNAP